MAVEVIYSDQRLPSFQDENLIFLAGPTPRLKFVASWRPEALIILEEIGFDGMVFVPEAEGGGWASTFEEQVEWEQEALEACSQFGCIAAWVPRDLETMPAFTTNVEFGLYVEGGRLLYGRPDGSPKTRYLDWIYKDRTEGEPFSNLRDLLVASVDMAYDF